jgi:hypothetical protein
MSLTKVSYSMINGSPINALDYGVVADGVTNNASAIEAALLAAKNSGAYGVYFPAGIYAIERNINAGALGVSNVWWIGDQGGNNNGGVSGGTTIIWKGAAGGTVISIGTTSSGTTIKGIAFNFVTANLPSGITSNIPGIAIDVVGLINGVKIENIGVFGCSIAGVQFDDVFQSHIVNSNFSFNEIGVNLTNVTNAITIDRCRFISNNKAVLSFQANVNTIKNSVLEHNFKGIEFITGSGSVDNCYFETTDINFDYFIKIGDFAVGFPSSISVTNSVFGFGTLPTALGYIVDIQRAAVNAKLVFSNNRFGCNTFAKIRIGGRLNGAIFKNNQITYNTSDVNVDDAFIIDTALDSFSPEYCFGLASHIDMNRDMTTYLLPNIQLVGADITHAYINGPLNGETITITKVAGVSVTLFQIPVSFLTAANLLGKWVNVSVFSKVASAAGNLFFTARDGAGGTTLASIAVPVSNTDWSRVSATFKVPASFVNSTLNIFIGGSGAYTATLSRIIFSSGATTRARLTNYVDS